MPARRTMEVLLTGAALLLAAGLRFINLGLQPLNDLEAPWALQALQVAEGLKPALDANPAYVHLTTILFYIFGPSNFAARLWSAVAGLLLAALPLLWREKLGRLPVLLLLFFLAIDPGLLVLSRLAGSSILAWTACLYGVTFWQRGRPSAAAACLALALLAGSGTWFAVTAWLMAWGFWSLLFATSPQAKARKPGSPARLNWNLFKGPAVTCLAALLALGTLLLFSPKGLSGIFTAPFEFISRLWQPSGTPALHLLLALPAYALMALVFGLTGVVHAFLDRDRTALQLSFWVLAAFLLAMLLPGRHVTDLAWVLLPLWVLAALELGRHADFPGVNPWEVGGAATLVVAILFFAWLDLLSVAGPAMLTNFGQLRLLLLAGALVLVGMILVLVSLGWSRRVARLGGVWGAAFILALFTLGMATGAAGLRQPVTEELWASSARIPEADLLLETAENISEWSQGAKASLPVSISGVESPALLWLLRDWEVQQSGSLSPLSNPAIVITADGQELNLGASYRGEGFTWRQTPNWGQAALTDWVSWFVHRSMPTTNEGVILWVRSDLLIDSQDKTLTP